MKILITRYGSVLLRGVLVGSILALHFILGHRHRRVDVMAEFSQVKVVEFLVEVLQLNTVRVEVPPMLEVDKGATVMLSQGKLSRRPQMLLLHVSTPYVINLRLCCLI